MWTSATCDESQESRILLRRNVYEAGNSRSNRCWRYWNGNRSPSGLRQALLLADFNEKLLESAAKELEVASYKVSTLKVDVSSRESVRALADAAAALGSVVNVVNTAGVSPNMAPPGRVLAVDLYGSAVVFEEFERVIAPGGAGLIVSSIVWWICARTVVVEVRATQRFHKLQGDKRLNRGKTNGRHHDYLRRGSGGVPTRLD